MRTVWLLLFLGCYSVRGSRLVQDDLQHLAAGRKTDTATVAVDNVGGLSIASTEAMPQTIALLVLSEPELRTTKHSIRGLISYENVAGESYLEMWTAYAEGEKYFTRTLAKGGSMKAILGSSDWRPFSLPFTGNGRSRPTGIELNVVFGGPGVVRLRDVELVEFSGSEDPLRLAGAWWGPRIAGLFAGLVGGAIGIAGGVIGWLTGKGRGRCAVLQATRVLSIVGVLILCMGGIAFLTGQPVEVIYPLVLVGGLTAIVFGTSRKSIFRSYELRQDAQVMPKIPATDTECSG